MADLLVGVLLIFLIILFYFALNFSLSVKELEDSKDEIIILKELKKEFSQSKIDLATALRSAETLTRNLGQMQIRAEDAEAKAHELQTILITISETRIELLKKIQRSLNKANFNIEIDEEGGIIRLPQGKLFDKGQFELSDAGKQNMALLKQALEEILPCFTRREKVTSNILKQRNCESSSKHSIEALLVEGHADSQPVKYNPNYKDNQELSTKRAISAFNILSDSSIIVGLKNTKNESLISVSGYGDRRPVCFQKTKKCYALNRRIDLRFIMEIPKTEK